MLRSSPARLAIIGHWVLLKSPLNTSDPQPIPVHGLKRPGKAAARAVPRHPKGALRQKGEQTGADKGQLLARTGRLGKAIAGPLRARAGSPDLRVGQDARTGSRSRPKAQADCQAVTPAQDRYPLPIQGAYKVMVLGGNSTYLAPGMGR